MTTRRFLYRMYRYIHACDSCTFAYPSQYLANDSLKDDELQGKSMETRVNFPNEGQTIAFGSCLAQSLD